MMDEDDFYALRCILWTGIGLGIVLMLGISVAVVKVIGWAL